MEKDPKHKGRHMAKRLECPVCHEGILPDNGPNKIAFHIKRGTINKCPGSGKKV
jgi:hypothetical protein